MIWNPIAFIGEFILGATPGAPLAADTNGQLVSGLSLIHVSSSSTATTSSSTDALLTTMSITPAAGSYMLWFDCDVTSPTAGAAISFSVYNNGTQIATSLRKIVPFSGGTLTTGNARAAVAISTPVTVTTGSVEIRWSTSSGTMTCGTRSMSMLRTS